MPINLEEGDVACLLRLQGEVNIAVAAEFKKVLLQALISRKDVQIDLERLTGVDVTALQLLWAAKHKAARSGMRFAVAGQLPEAIANALADAGFEKFPVPLEQL